MLSKRKSISQSLFHVHYLGQTPVDRRCAVSVLPWIIEELKLKLGDQEEINLMWLTPGPEGVTYVANNGQEKLNHTYQNIIQCCKATDEVSFAYIMKGQKDTSYTCHVFQALTPDEASMITQQLQDRASSCGPWAGLSDSSAHSSSSNLLTVPEGSLGSQSLPCSDEYSPEYVGCMALDSGLGSSAALDKVVRKLREKRKKAQGQLKKQKKSLPAQVPGEANSEDKVSASNGGGGGTGAVRSDVVGNGDNFVASLIVPSGDTRSDSSSEGGGGKEGTTGSQSTAESGPLSPLSCVPSSTNESNSPENRYSLVSRLSTGSGTSPGQEEGEEEGGEEDASKVQCEERIRSATTLCPDKTETHTIGEQNAATTSGVRQNQPMLDVGLGPRLQLEVPAGHSLGVSMETLPLMSVDVDNLGGVDEALNSTLLEDSTELPGRRVRWTLVDRVVSVCGGEAGELLLRWSLKATSVDCIKGKENFNNIALIGRNLKPNSYVCHLFKTDSEKQAEEMVETFKMAAVSSLSQDLPMALCDNCPLQELHRLCDQLEGASTQVAQAKLQTCLDTLGEQYYDSLVKQYKAAKTENEHIQIVLLISLLRRHFQQEQLKHTHGTEAQSIPKESDNTARTRSFSTITQPPKTFMGKLLARKKQFKALKDAEVSDEGKGQVSNSQPPRPHSPIFSRKSDLKTLLSPVNQATEPKAKVDEKAKADEKMNVDDKVKGDEKMKVDEKKVKKNFFWSKSKEAGEVTDAEVLESSGDSNTETTVSSAGAYQLSKEVSDPLTSDVSRASSDNTLSSTLSSEMQQEFKIPTTPIMRNRNLRLRTSPSDPFSTPSSASNTPFRVGHRRTTSLRQQIFESITTPAKVDTLGDQRSNLSLFEQRERTNSDPKQDQAKNWWRKAIKQQIALNKLERLSPRDIQFNKLAYEDNDMDVAEATQTWYRILSETPECSDDVIKTALGIGVPPSLRGQVWEYLIGRYHTRNRPDFNCAAFSMKEYNQLCHEQTEYSHVIKIDLGRSFPKHPYFKSACSEGQVLMHNVLHAYAVLDKEVGYCQGLSFVAGVIVMHAKDEETAFWTFTQLLRLYNHREVYLTASFYHLQVRLYQLSRLLHDYYPVLHSHLQKYEVPPFLYAAPWFLALFASQFSIPFSSRLMDLHFYDGGSALFKISLSLFEQYQEHILEYNTMESILGFLKITMPSLAAKDIQTLFKRALHYDLGNKLETFETEYDVIEDLTARFNMDGAILDLDTMQETLRKQNKELIEQLAICHTSIRKLETTVSGLVSVINGQEQRLRRLEGNFQPSSPSHL